MASLPNTSATNMAPVMSNGTGEPDSFDKFFESWLVEQNRNLQELVSASTNNHNQSSTTTTESPQGDQHRDRALPALINRVVLHYEQYYEAKASWANHNVLPMLSPPWLSSLEDTYLWIGGWRPSMAFHLLYSKSGLQFEARLAEFFLGFPSGDLGYLCPTQLYQVNELQIKTLREERETTEKMAKQQETVANTSMVNLSHVASDLMRSDQESTQERVEETKDRVRVEVAHKKEGLGEVLHRADDLRLRTLKGVIDILTPIQAVHFLIAAAELHLRLHDWGKMTEAE
ncbi:protein DOG1-like 4 [Cornus florida]|uniref:protein DOG1-like 4 n=1 Tax=Cornus florida TaxID=4283 RepID=UPI002898DA60|nr:protein DOG1-like 4 [Cornus florida]